MKKIVAILTVIATLLLTGCNNDSNRDVSDGNTSDTQSDASVSDDIIDNTSENASESNDNMQNEDVPNSNNDNELTSENESGDDGIMQSNGEIVANKFVKPALSSKLIGWGLGKETDAENRPLDAVNAQEKYAQYNVAFIGENEKKIYLTFDEGYENGYTAQILDTLKEKQVKAIFFVTYDYCKSSPELVQRMIDEGHVVGNHSYSHASFPECSEKEVREEITLLHDYVKENFNYEMSLVRFPKGEFSEKTLEIASSLGYKSVFWSFAYADWDKDSQMNPAEAYDKIANASHNGAIYLLHAVSQTNAEILNDVIDFWQDNDYEIAIFS